MPPPAEIAFCLQIGADDVYQVVLVIGALFVQVIHGIAVAVVILIGLFILPVDEGPGLELPRPRSVVVGRGLQGVAVVVVNALRTLSYWRTGRRCR